MDSIYSSKQVPSNSDKQDIIVSIDADNPANTLQTLISSIRDVLNNTPKGEIIYVFITMGQFQNRTFYWPMFFQYIDQVSSESGVQFEIMFRGVISTDMMSVFKFKTLSVSVSESIIATTSSTAILRFMSNHSTDMKVISNYFPALIHCTYDNNYSTPFGVEFLTKHNFKFEIF